MNSKDLYNIQEAYLDVYNELDEERAPGVKPYEPRKRRPLDPEKALSGEKGDGSGYGADEKFKKPDDKIKKPGTEVPAPKKGGYGRIFSNIPYGIGAHANRNRSRNSTIRGMDPGAPKSEVIAPKDKKKASKEVVRMNKEDFDLYDVILSHLIDEGYADTQEAAEAIMVNMSEDWRESIFEEVEQLDEISDKMVIAARNKLAKNTNRSVSALSRRDSFINDINREGRMNTKIQARNQRTGSNVEPTFLRRHE